MRSISLPFLKMRDYFVYWCGCGQKKKKKQQKEKREREAYLHCMLHFGLTKQKNKMICFVFALTNGWSHKPNKNPSHLVCHCCIVGIACVVHSEKLTNRICLIDAYRRSTLVILMVGFQRLSWMSARFQLVCCWCFCFVFFSGNFSFSGSNRTFVQNLTWKLKRFFCHGN